MSWRNICLGEGNWGRKIAACCALPPGSGMVWQRFPFTTSPIPGCARRSSTKPRGAGARTRLGVAMASKRKNKRSVLREDLSRPSKWRLQHGEFTASIREADPETGRPVQHSYAIDTLIGPFRMTAYGCLPLWIQGEGRCGKRLGSHSKSPEHIRFRFRLLCGVEFAVVMLCTA